MTYGIKKKSDASFTDTIERVKAALAEEGFGVLTDIDVAETLKKKLDVSWDAYRILGACNPKLAYRALTADREIGLLLPCNVIVYEEDGSVFVSAILPSAAMAAVDSDDIRAVAEEAEEKLRRVIERV